MSTIVQEVARLQRVSERQSTMLALALKEKNNLRIDLNIALAKLHAAEQTLQAACQNRLTPSISPLPKPKFRINQIVWSLTQEGKDYKISQVYVSHWNEKARSWEYETQTSLGYYTLECFYRALKPEEI